MSSDNFWYVKGPKVFMGDASDYAYALEKAEKRADTKFKERLAKRNPYHVAESHSAAVAWARSEYAEYGIYWIDEEGGSGE